MNNDSEFNTERSSNASARKNARRKSKKRTDKDVQILTTETSKSVQNIQTAALPRTVQNIHDKPCARFKSSSSGMIREVKQIPQFQKSVLKCSKISTDGSGTFNATEPTKNLQPSSATLKNRTDVDNFYNSTTQAKNLVQYSPSVKNQSVVSFSDTVQAKNLIQSLSASHKNQNVVNRSSDAKQAQNFVQSSSLKNQNVANRSSNAILAKNLMQSLSASHKNPNLVNRSSDAIQAQNFVQSSSASLKNQNVENRSSDAIQAQFVQSSSLKNQNEVSFSDSTCRNVQRSSYSSLKNRNQVQDSISDHLIRRESSSVQSSALNVHIGVNAPNAKPENNSIRYSLNGRSFEPNQTYAVPLEDGRYYLLKVSNPESEQQVLAKSASLTKSGSATFNRSSNIRTGDAASLNGFSITNKRDAPLLNNSSIFNNGGADYRNSSSIINSGGALSHNGSSIFNNGGADYRNSSSINSGGAASLNGLSILNNGGAASLNDSSILNSGGVVYSNSSSIMNSGGSAPLVGAYFHKNGGTEYRNGSLITNSRDATAHYDLSNINIGGAASVNDTSIVHKHNRGPPPSYEKSIMKIKDVTSHRGSYTKASWSSSAGTVDEGSILRRRLLIPDAKAYSVPAASSKDDEEWAIPDSDEELEDGINWEPLPDQIKDMYAILESGKTLDLDWENPGRRPPSTKSNHSDTNDQGIVTEENNTMVPEPNEFDFEDEFSVSDHPSKLANRKKGQVTQKRVARLDKVMFDIKRHTKLEKLQQKIVKSQSPQQPSPAPTAAEEASETS